VLEREKERKRERERTCSQNEVPAFVPKGKYYPSLVAFLDYHPGFPPPFLLQGSERKIVLKDTKLSQTKKNKIKPNKGR
jgi:hypothetical protein